MKKKILFVMQLYPPIHGASTAGENIKSSIYINDSFDCDYVRISTIPIGGGGFFKKIYTFIKLYITVFKLLLNNKYDLVYLAPNAAGYKFYKDFGLCMLCKSFSTKVVYHFHNKGISVNRFVPNFLMRCYFKNVNVILSSPLLKYDVSDYVAQEKIIYCPYGIPDIKSRIVNEKRTICNILFFSHMIISKGVFDLLNACVILNKKGIEFKCNFVGSWYDVKESDFNDFVSSNKLSEKVSFIGPQYGESKDIVLANTDIFAFPTFYPDECFPLGLLEALRFSLPVITTREGAIADIVEDSINGFLIPQHDPNALAIKLEWLINNSELRKQMGVAGRKIFENEFTLDKFENRIVEILNDVAEK